MTTKTPPQHKPQTPIHKRAYIDTTKFLKVCKKIGCPDFFVDDFLSYQNNKNWIMNGERIKKPLGAFINWARKRKRTMLNAGSWRGAKNENWEFTPAVFLGFRNEKNFNTEKYIKRLIYKANYKKPMTQQELKLSEQMGIFKEIESLKDNDEPAKPIYRIKCTSCGFCKLSFYPYEYSFCIVCRTNESFEIITKEDFLNDDRRI